MTRRRGGGRRSKGPVQDAAIHKSATCDGTKAAKPWVHLCAVLLSAAPVWSCDAVLTMLHQGNAYADHQDLKPCDARADLDRERGCFREQFWKVVDLQGYGDMGTIPSVAERWTSSSGWRWCWRDLRGLKTIISMGSADHLLFGLSSDRCVSDWSCPMKAIQTSWP